MAGNVANPPATGDEHLETCEECGLKGEHAETCSKSICHECGAVGGGHYVKCSKNTSTVDGTAAGVRTDGAPPPEQPTLIRVADAEILRTIAKKRAEFDEVETAWKQLGKRKRNLKDDLDEMLEHVRERVDEQDQEDLFAEQTADDADPRCPNERCIRRAHGDSLCKDANGREFDGKIKNVTPPAPARDDGTIEGEAIAVDRKGAAGKRGEHRPQPALPAAPKKPRKKRGQTNAQAIVEWSARMTEKTGRKDVRDTTAGRRLNWTQALAREVYGPEWKTSMPSDGAITDAALLRAQRWEAGEEPEWTGK